MNSTSYLRSFGRLWPILLAGFFITAGGNVKSAPIRLAIVGFSAEPLSSNTTQEAAALVDLLTALLSTNASFELVERREVERILSEQSLSLAQVSNLKEGAAAGKLLRADWVLIGQVIKDKSGMSLLTKVIDARTTIIRDVSILPLGKEGLIGLASPIARFVGTAQDPSTNRPSRTYIAVGFFDDVGVNNRYADFGSKLRRRLSAAYQGTDMVVLERDDVAPLLAELRMSQMGFGQETNGATQAQGAFVLIDGIYQAYQDEKSKLNLVLRLEHLGQGIKTLQFNEPPGDELEQKIVAAIGRELKEPPTNAPSRRDEAQRQLVIGKALLHVPAEDGVHRPDSVMSIWIPGYENIKNERPEALKALESALLLDPDNPEMKLYLGYCLLTPEIKRHAEGVAYLLEVIAGSTNEVHRRSARETLAGMERDPAQAAAMFERLSQELAHAPQDQARYRRALENIYDRLFQLAQLTREQRADKQADMLRIELKAAVWRGKDGAFLNVAQDLSEILARFRLILGRQQETVNEYLDRIWPSLEAEVPEMIPYMQCAYIRQTSPQIPDNWRTKYLDLLQKIDRNPEQVFNPRSFFERSLTRDLNSHMHSRQYDLARKVADLLNKHGRPHLRGKGTNEVDVVRGLLYRQQGELKEAVAAFEQVGDQTVQLTYDGPWGRQRKFNGTALAAETRHLLAGTKAEPLPIEPLNDVVLRSETRVLIASDGPRLWCLDERGLSEYTKQDAHFRALPIATLARHRPHALAVGEADLWIGTAGDGLIAINKASHQIRRYGLEQGLLQTNINSLAVQGDTLWIGFGSRELHAKGGTGFLDLASDKFVAVMGELNPDAVEIRGGRRSTSGLTVPGQAGYHIVEEFHPLGSGDLLLLALGGLNRLQLTNHTSVPFCKDRSLQCAARNERFVIAGTDSDGLLIYDHSAANRQTVTQAAGLPDNFIRAVAIDGDRGYVGGRGFVAAINLPQARVEKIYPLLHAEKVVGIELNGNDAWILAYAEPAGSRVYRLGLEH